MATIQRPVKTYGTRSYVAEVAAAPGNEDPILATEVDGDLDTIYSAWNGGVDTVNIKDGAVTTAKIGDGQVTYAKLAADAKLWQDTGTALTPGASYTTRRLTVPGPTTGEASDQASMVFGQLTQKSRLLSMPGTAYSAHTLNARWTGAAWAQDDAAKPSWMMSLDGASDLWTLFRIPAGSTTPANMMRLDNAGTLILPGVNHQIGLRGHVAADGNFVQLYHNSSLSGGYVQGQSGWVLQLAGNFGGDTCSIARRAAGSTTFANIAVFSNNGDFQIFGANATKASGTAWINPSDDRLKKDIAPYATGLQAILALDPITFKFNGQGGSQDDAPGMGFSAQAVQAVMSEMVSVRAGKLAETDEADTEILMLDTTALPLALVNAVKELAARVEALEAR